MTTQLAIVFPGQGSQSVGMLAELAADHSVVKDVFAEASDAIGIDLWQLSQQGPKDRLNDTRNTQPALLCAGVAVWQVLRQSSCPDALVCAGHSLGEYSALVASGVLALGDAVRLVARRGEFMQEAVPPGVGAMAAILGLDDAAVRQACAEGADGQVVEAVNFNAPGQVVIAGHVEAVERAVGLCKAAGAKRAVLLDVSVPSHCALMKPASDRLAEVIGDVTMRAPTIPVLHNVTVEEAADADDIRRLLLDQLSKPVRWVETMQAIKSRGADLVVEAGPGKVLSGLARRIDRELVTLPVFDPASLEKVMETLNA